MNIKFGFLSIILSIFMIDYNNARFVKHSMAFFGF